MSNLVRLRASSLPELFDCPRRWCAKHMEHIHMPTSGAAHLGTAVHAGTAVFDQSAISNQMLTVDDCAGVVVDTIFDKATEIDWGESSPKEAEPIAISLFRKYCDQIAPQFEYAGVEVECDNLEITDLGIVLTGTTDRVYVDPVSGQLGIADLKTGKAAVAADGTVKTSGHAAQIGVYEILTEQALGRPIDAPAKIVGMTTAKTEAARRVGVGSIQDAKGLLVGDEETPGMLEVASDIIKSGRYYGNARSSLCSSRYCPVYSSCKYRR